MEASELECCLTVEHLNSNGVVTKRRTYKSITVVLGRDEFRDIALRIVSSQSPLGKTFLLKELTIHKRFFTGREGYHQTSNTEDTNNVFELSIESALDGFKMSVIETCSK